MQRRRTTTIRDVAEAAGVSIGTVSKALNGRGHVSDEARSRVKEAAARLNFRPNDLAQSLHRRRSFSVGIVSNDIYGRFTLPILGGIEQALAARGVSVFLCNGADDSGRLGRHLDSLLSKRVDGLILTARRSDHAFDLLPEQIAVPVLYVYARGPDAQSPCLLPDDQGGGRQATSHLINLGRRRIAHVTGPAHFEAVRLRQAGYRTALREAGQDFDEALALSGSWSEAWGHAAVDRLFGRPREQPDAIFCGSDQIARGVADALRERGLHVPRDVAIVGFDNWEIMAAATRPPLTTVDPELEALGRQAGRTILDLVDGEPAPSTAIRLPCRLVIRESCGDSRRRLPTRTDGSAEAVTT